MPKLINNVSAQLNDINTTGVEVFRPMLGVTQSGDYINQNGLKGYIQDMNFAGTFETQMKPLGFGLKNNSLTIELEISY